MSAAPALAGIEACVFDAYGTLLDIGSAVAAEAAAVGPAAARLNALWRQKQLEYTWLRSLMQRHADFHAITADALDYGLEACGIADAALRDRLLARYDALDPYPEVAATLERLKAAGMPLAVLSNGTPAMLERGLASAGIGQLLDAVLSVEAAGLFKPAPKVYALATARLGLPAARIAFLSSNGWDIHGAGAFGFQGVWVNRQGSPPERLPGAPRHVLGSLEPLPALLGLA